MSNTEENYLDNLLKAVSEPDEAAPAKEEHAEASIEDKLGASLGIPDGHSAVRPHYYWG